MSTAEQDRAEAYESIDAAFTTHMDEWVLEGDDHLSTLIMDALAPVIAGIRREAAAAHDAGQGIVRVRLDDAAVERAAKAMFAEEQCDPRQMLDVEGNWNSRLNDRDKEEYRCLTRAVIATLKEGQ